MAEAVDRSSEQTASEDQIRELQASWLWKITHSTEKEINNLILKRKLLVTIPISYSCDCGADTCSDFAENFRIERKNDLLRLYHVVLKGTCKTDCIDVPDKPLFPLTSFLDQKKITNPNVLLPYSQYRNRGNVAFYCSHVFIAMGMKSSYLTVERVHKSMKKPGDCTLKHKLSNFDLMIEHKQYDILYAGLYTQDIVIGRTFRHECRSILLSGRSLTSDLFKGPIAQNDVKACDILLPAAVMQANRCYTKAEGCLFKCIPLIIKFQTYDCLRSFLPYLVKYTDIKQRRKRDWEFVDECMKDSLIVKNLMTHRVLPHTMVLNEAVKQGAIDIVKWIKDNFPLQDEARSVPHVIQATVDDSPEMLKVLLSAPISNNKLSFTFKGHSALQLAIAFNFRECSDILRQYDMSHKEKEPFLLNILYDFHCTKHRTAQLLSRMIFSGYDVNGSFDVGQFPCVPLYDAIVHLDLEIIQILLANGAMLFNKKDITVLGCPPRLLAEYIHHNVDICTEEGSVLNDILEGGKKREKLLYLVLYAAHTVPQNDRQRLSELCSDPDFYACSRTMQFLNNPRTLSILCRNSLRKYYGHKIHLFLDSVVLPKYFKEFLNLQDVLKPYMELPLSFTKCYEALEDDAFVSDFPSTVFATKVHVS